MARKYTPQLYWHIHHNSLSEFSTTPITKRKYYIKANKPLHEVKTRLRLLKKVDLSEEPELREILSWLRRNDDYYYNEYYNDYYNDYYLKFPLEKQILIYMIIQFRQRVEALHNKQCLNCPWNGKEIDFSKA